ncbi:MAG: alginate lyase family protein [Planctomycetota bacterium]
MQNQSFARLLSASILVFTSGLSGLACTAQADLPASFQPTLLDADAVTAVRDDIQAGEATPEQIAALAELVNKADESLEMPIRSVIEKPQAPASGSLHDYVSLSPYWWPNPDTDDGLPYVRRDGEFNPERDQYDVPKLSDLSNAVRWLGFAYYYTGNEAYAKNAIERCRVWFVDPATRMTPRVQFGQFIPGVEDEGRHFGIIETVRLRWFPDAFAMLEGSPHMTDDLREGVRQWFADYADWLTNSEFGVAERTYPNNHGTWANAQIANYAWFGGREDLARAAVESIPARIEHQIMSDGLQPHEAERTTSLHYHDFNLRAYLDLAKIGQRLDIDLYHFETEEGASIRKAAEFLVPYLLEQKEWPYEQIRDPKAYMHAQAMRMAALAYDEPAFEETLPVLMTWPGMKPEGLVYTELLLPNLQVPAETP